MTAWLLYRTPWGLDLRTVGENPRAADAAGVSVWGMRTQALVIGGALMGMAGAYPHHLAVQRLHLRRRSPGAAGWRSRSSSSACGAPGAAPPARCSSPRSRRLQLRLQANNVLHLPYQVFLMLPFVMTIVAMALVSRNARAPAALLVPFRKEER